MSRHPIALLRAAALFLPAFPVVAGAQAPERSLPVFVNGQAQVVPAFQDSTRWIRQELWVETEFDSDGDGKRDRVHVDVTRPWQTDAEGLKVPVIYESSPYFAGTSGPRQFLWDVKQEVGAVPKPRTSQPEIPFQPVAAADLRTPKSARGCRAGLPWCTPRRRGPGSRRDARPSAARPKNSHPRPSSTGSTGARRDSRRRPATTQVVASWTTGKVGMTGTSYNGTLPLAAATTGVKGLEAIIPIAPNTSYYHYYRSNGLVRHPGGWLGEDIDFLYDFIHSGDPATRAYCNRTVRDGLFAAGSRPPVGRLQRVLGRARPASAG